MSYPVHICDLMPLHRRSQDSGKGGSTAKGDHRLGKNFGRWIAISVNDF